MPDLRQLTFGNYGHTLNRRQVASPDRKWVAYDVRNDDTQIASTDAIEMVHVDSGEIVRLYQTDRQSKFGPGVGAVSFHPRERRIVFIHGLESCSEEKPYSAARRFGAIVEIDSPGRMVHAESRFVAPDSKLSTLEMGILGGGTHAHSWNSEGWISFTYNDARLERLSRLDAKIRDLRTVGFMLPEKPNTNRSDWGPASSEDFLGTYTAFVAAQVRPFAKHGSDEIEQAVEECWLGNVQANAGIESKHTLSMAFQGAVRDEAGSLVHEIFRCDLPSLEKLQDVNGQRVDDSDPYAGLRAVPGCHQQRLTVTVGRKFPGVRGPRNWLVSSPGGEYVYFPTADDSGIVQLFRVPSTGGDIQQITDLENSIGDQISLDESGLKCAFIADQRICLVDLVSGEHQWLTTRGQHVLVGAVHFMKQDQWVINAYAKTESQPFLQIFACE
jgi:hypothetical protein